jgi:DivIVA domain-containing protein
MAEVPEFVTANEVHEVKFGTSRFRAGYNMGDVDAFLDRVEATLHRLERELGDARDAEAMLRSQCERLQERHDQSSGTSTEPVPVVAAEADVLAARRKAEQIRGTLRTMLQQQLALLED